MSKTKKITICAMMVALATVLAWISNALPFKWLQGGSITLASMVPIIVASVITGPKWGLLSSVVYALIQMLMGGVAAPPVQDFFSYLLVIMLDYIIIQIGRIVYICEKFNLLLTISIILYYHLYRNN